MAQKAPARVFVVGREPEPRQQRADGDDDRVGGLILQPAVVHVDNAVTFGLIDARDDFTVSDAEGRLHLVAVMQGTRHADDLVHVAEPRQQPDAFDLLILQLLGVGQVLQLAAAALLEERAAVALARPRGLLCHGSAPAVFLHAAAHGELQHDQRGHRADGGNGIALLFHSRFRPFGQRSIVKLN